MIFAELQSMEIFARDEPADDETPAGGQNQSTACNQIDTKNALIPPKINE